MEIKRNRYLNKLILKKHNGLIKVVTGIRRCGKSYLLSNIFKEHLLATGADERHIIEMSFDSFTVLREITIITGYIWTRRRTLIN